MTRDTDTIKDGEPVTPPKAEATAPPQEFDGFVLAADILDELSVNLWKGDGVITYPVGQGELSRVEVGPGLVSLIGGPPGAGKTALTMQLIVDALRLTPTLKVLVGNVEMTPAVLLERQVARLSGVDLTAIRHRQLRDSHRERIDLATAELRKICDRLCFAKPPITMARIAATAPAFLGSDPGLLLIDYLQRIAPLDKPDGKRDAVDKNMSFLRAVANLGKAVIIVSAMARSKDQNGRSSYGDGLGLASFRESSELEYDADNAWLLVANDRADKSKMVLRHLKDRHGECRNIELNFDGAHQHFSCQNENATPLPSNGDEPTEPAPPCQNVPCGPGSQNQE